MDKRPKSGGDIMPPHWALKILLFRIIPGLLFLLICFGGAWRPYAGVAFIIFSVAMIAYGRNERGDRVLFGMRLNDDGSVNTEWPKFGRKKQKMSVLSSKSETLSEAGQAVLQRVETKILLAPVFLFLALGACAQSVKDETMGIEAQDARALFAKHDEDGRLANTDIEKVGDIHVGSRTFSIFDLNFTNPVSRHGMQHVAILEGQKFLGAYQTDGAIISLESDAIKFSCPDYDVQCSRSEFQSISLTKGRLPQHVLIYGLVQDLSNTI